MDTGRPKTAKMKFMGPTAQYSSLEHRWNEDILEELKEDTVKNKLAQYKQKWLNHFSRMEDIRYPKQLHDHQPIRKRPGWLLQKLLLDAYNCAAERGLLLA